MLARMAKRGAHIGEEAGEQAEPGPVVEFDLALVDGLDQLHPEVVFGQRAAGALLQQ